MPSRGKGGFCLAAYPAVVARLPEAGREVRGGRLAPSPPARPLPAVPLSRGRGRPAPRLRVAAWGGRGDTGGQGTGEPVPKAQRKPHCLPKQEPCHCSAKGELVCSLHPCIPASLHPCPAKCDAICIPASLHLCFPASLHPCPVKSEVAGSLHPGFPASLPHEGQGSLQLASLPLADPVPATPAFIFPKDLPELEEAQSGASRMFCGGNSCDVHMDEETPRGDDRRLNYYPKCQGKGEEG